MIFKLIIILFLFIIFYSLGSALVFLVRDKGDSDRVAKALTWRVSLSLFLFVLILMAYALGWINPHSI
jgi:hypothetical protein